MVLTADSRLAVDTQLPLKPALSARHSSRCMVKWCCVVVLMVERDTCTTTIPFLPCFRLTTDAMASAQHTSVSLLLSVYLAAFPTSWQLRGHLDAPILGVNSCSSCSCIQGYILRQQVRCSAQKVQKLPEGDFHKVILVSNETILVSVNYASKGFGMS